MRFARLAALCCLTALGAAPARAQSNGPLSMEVGDAGTGWRPVVRVRGLLSDPGLRDALASGLPLRVHVRVELWEKGWVDQLAGSQEVLVAVAQDPLDRSFVVETSRGEQHYRSLADAEAAVYSVLVFSLHPAATRGRFYYLGSLEVRSLSLSDLDELRRWLRGEARPAAEGRAPVERALARGFSRLFVRLVGLPTRRYEARTATFRPR